MVLLPETTCQSQHKLASFYLRENANTSGTAFWENNGLSCMAFRFILGPLSLVRDAAQSGDWFSLSGTITTEDSQAHEWNIVKASESSSLGENS